MSRLHDSVNDRALALANAIDPAINEAVDLLLASHSTDNSTTDERTVALVHVFCGILMRHCPDPDAHGSCACYVTQLGSLVMEALSKHCG